MDSIDSMDSFEKKEENAPEEKRYEPHREKEKHHTEHKEHKEHKHKEPKERHEKMKKEETVTISKVAMWKGIAAVLAVLLVISIYSGGFGYESSTTQGKNAAAPTPKAADAPTPTPTPTLDMEELVDDDTRKGDKDAPITIVEFSDFECPFCARFYSDTLKQIDEKYIKTGKVQLYYRDFPLSFHQNAQKAGEASECAGEQGKFWEMHDLLFEKGVVGGVVTFKKYAKDLGLDTGKFNVCLDSGAQEDEVKKDFLDGQKAGIQGTPGFIVNGVPISGAQPFSVFEQVIESMLEE